jgi:hypothetical protein
MDLASRCAGKGKIDNEKCRNPAKSKTCIASQQKSLTFFLIANYEFPLSSVVSIFKKSEL